MPEITDVKQKAISAPKKFLLQDQPFSPTRQRVADKRVKNIDSFMPRLSPRVMNRNQRGSNATQGAFAGERKASNGWLLTIAVALP